MRKPGLFRRLTEALFDDVSVRDRADRPPQPASLAPLPSLPSLEPVPEPGGALQAAMPSWIEAALPTSAPEPAAAPAAPRRDDALAVAHATQAHPPFEARLQSVAASPAPACAGKL